MQFLRVSSVVAAAVAGAAACDLGLKPYADPVDAALPPPVDVPRDASDAPPFVVDAGAPRDARSDAPDAQPFTKRVFVTSAQFGGALGGLAGADAQCQTAAAAAGLPGRYLAWLSDEDALAAERLPARESWGLVTGARVFASREATATAPEVEIDVDERGAKRVGELVWTGTLAAGGSADTCNGWMLSVGRGTIGQTSRRDREWTQSGIAQCSVRHRLYCFER